MSAYQNYINFVNQQVEKFTGDKMSAESYQKAKDEICRFCDTHNLEEECPLSEIMIKALDEQIKDAINETHLLNQAKKIINQH